MQTFRYAEHMAIVIDDAFLPAKLRGQPMTDGEFSVFCAEHPDLSFEMSADGEIIVMPPTYSWTGIRNQEIGGQLRNWARLDGRGVVSDSSTGFVLPNGARRSPDAGWTLKSRIAQQPKETQNQFWHLCPDFVIELKSKTDRARDLDQKMREYLSNGASLGWLIDPETRTVTIYRSESEPETLESVDAVTGESPVAGFQLQLTSVWNPLA
jgi:Uma2 family endonuclease